MIIVLFGQPHSGKTTLAQQLESNYHIDGDHLRTMFKNKDYSKQGRINNLNRASDIATYLHYNGNDVIMSLVYPYKEARDYLNSLVPDVIWVYLHYEGERGREEFHVKDFELDLLEEKVLPLSTSRWSVEECIHLINDYVKRRKS
jgi:adenylylsulfate kinase-like enzyme